MNGIAPAYLFFFFFSFLSPRHSYLKTAHVSIRFIQPHSFFQPIISQDESGGVNGVVLSEG
jgi:hypothetical protein